MRIIDDEELGTIVLFETQDEKDAILSLLALFSRDDTNPLTKATDDLYDGLTSTHKTLYAVYIMDTDGKRAYTLSFGEPR